MCDGSKPRAPRGTRLVSGGSVRVGNVATYRCNSNGAFFLQARCLPNGRFSR